MSKVIKQDSKFGDIKIDKAIEGDEAISLIQQHEGKDWVIIEKSKAREVALAICPELSQPELKAVKTAEEIFKKTRIVKIGIGQFYGVQIVIDIVNEYISQLSQPKGEVEFAEFAEWCSENFRRTYPTEKVYENKENKKLWFPQKTWDGYFKKEPHTTEQLLQIYLTEKQKP